jgi:hypothetical protein
LVTNGFGFTPQALAEQNVTVSINQPFQIGYNLDALDIALKMPLQDAQMYAERKLIKPVAEAMAQAVESAAALWIYQNTNSYVGVLGTNPTTTLQYFQARAALVNKACPQSGQDEVGRLMDIATFISPQMETSLSQAVATVFQPSSTVSGAFKNGFLGQIAGQDVYESASLYQHTAGTIAGTFTVNGANQNGNSLTVNLTAGDTLNVGDCFTIANVNEVNPQTRRSFGSLFSFCVAQPLVAVGGGADIIQLTSGSTIIGPGSQYQSVDSLPVNGATCTLWNGTTSPNGKSGLNGFTMHSDAYAMASLPLYEPKAAEWAKTATDKRTGLNISWLKMLDPVTRQLISRCDAVFGFGNFYPNNLSIRQLSLT